MPHGNCSSCVNVNSAVIEKESKTCLLTLPNNIFLQARGTTLLCQMVIKAACCWFGSFFHFLSFPWLQRRVVDSLICWLRLIQEGGHVPKCSAFLLGNTYLPICNHIQGLQDKFQIYVFYCSVLECFPIASVRYIINWFLDELQAWTWASLLHSSAVSVMQAAPDLWFCEMD